MTLGFSTIDDSRGPRLVVMEVSACFMSTTVIACVNQYNQGPADKILYENAVGNHHGPTSQWAGRPTNPWKDWQTDWWTHPLKEMWALIEWDARTCKTFALKSLHSWHFFTKVTDGPMDRPTDRRTHLLKRFKDASKTDYEGDHIMLSQFYCIC